MRKCARLTAHAWMPSCAGAPNGLLQRVRHHSAWHRHGRTTWNMRTCSAFSANGESMHVAFIRKCIRSLSSEITRLFGLSPLVLHFETYIEINGDHAKTLVMPTSCCLIGNQPDTCKAYIRLGCSICKHEDILTRLQQWLPARLPLWRTPMLAASHTRSRCP